MKKLLSLLISVICILMLCSCSGKSAEPVRTVEGNMKTYSEMSDGTWQADGISYKYRLEISGRLPNAVSDSTYIYLSNIESITFEQAYKNILSSSTEDFFNPDDAVLVELK